MLHSSGVWGKTKSLVLHLWKRAHPTPHRSVLHCQVRTYQVKIQYCYPVLHLLHLPRGITSRERASRKQTTKHVHGLRKARTKWLVYHFRAKWIVKTELKLPFSNGQRAKLPHPTNLGYGDVNCFGQWSISTWNTHGSINCVWSGLPSCAYVITRELLDFSILAQVWRGTQME